MTVLEIQNALMAAGFNPGAPDGIRGRKTIGAIKAFQATNGLEADGIVGPLTRQALFGDTPAAAAAAVSAAEFVVPMTTPWLQEAESLRGVAEIAGDESNQTIIDWADGLGIDYEDDDVPWCGLFAAHCVGSQMTDEPLPTVPLRARAWENFGVPCDPQPGAVMVFWRVSRTSGKGHVGFYWGEDGRAYHVLGGNQSNAVTVTRVGKDRLLGARWPSTAMPPDGASRMLLANGQPVSTNEA